MARQLDGLAIGMIGAGAMLAYAGFKGYSIPHALQAFVQGKPPSGPPQYPVAGGGGAAGSTAASAGGSIPVSGPGETTWITTFLLALGAPPTKANIDSVTAWIAKEDPWDGNPPDGALYTHNPLNVEGGWGVIGGVQGAPAVSIYKDAATGMANTVARLRQPFAADILAALRTGRGLCGQSLAGLSAWSGGGYSSVC